MAYFIKTTSRTTFSKYIVQAATAEEAQAQDGEYIGVVDGDDDLPAQISEAFSTKEEAFNSSDGYTEWR